MLYVICTALVVLGVVWEGENYPKAKQHRGWKLLIAALSAEVFFGILIFAVDGWISKIQKDEIFALESVSRP